MLVKNEADASIIAKSMKGGNIEVLLQWIDANKEKLYRMSWSYLRNNTDVEDAFHNTIIKAFQNIMKLQNEQAFEGWFVSILLNECRKILRDRRKVQPSGYASLGDTTYGSIDQAESLDLINALNSIDKKYKELIILKYCSGYSQKEIAEILNMPLGTVKTKIFRGLKMLRKILRREA